MRITFNDFINCKKEALITLEILVDNIKKEKRRIDSNNF